MGRWPILQADRSYLHQASKRNYLFEQCDGAIIDAANQGDLIRFANGCSTSDKGKNCETAHRLFGDNRLIMVTSAFRRHASADREAKRFGEERRLSSIMGERCLPAQSRADGVVSTLSTINMLERWNTPRHDDPSCHLTITTTDRKSVV